MSKARSHILFSLMILMLAALFTSRALLAIAMIAFIVVACFHPNTKEHFKEFFKQPVLWGMNLLFFFPLISGFWSENHQQWLQMMQIKLPLLLFPFAFAAPFRLTGSQWSWLGYSFTGMMLLACGWTLINYTTDTEAVNASYLQAKTMITPLENDHVRFSWLIYAAALLSGWNFYNSRKNSLSVIWMILCSLFILFLHFLASRTGLLALYSSLLILITWLIFKRRKTSPITLSLYTLYIFLLVLPLAAYYFFPSFQNKIKYLNYEKDFFSNGTYVPHSNDGVRMISIKAGWNIMNSHPLTGVGYGDVHDATQSWYNENYPQMLESDKIYPSSEYLLYGSGVGWTGLLVFLLVMVIPFFVPVVFPLPWLMLNSSLALSFLFDIGLEVQFGVFIYSFFVLWWWKWMKSQNMASL